MGILRRVQRAVEYFITTAFALMVLMAIVQATARYIFRYPLGWTDEAARFLLIWTTFLGIPVLAARRTLMRMDALVAFLPSRIRAAIELASSTASAAFLVWLAWLGKELLPIAARQLSPALRIPYTYFYFSLPIGLLLGAVYLVAASIEQVGKKTS